MLKVGLTGGIGSGKTIVAQVFNTIGIPVFCADIEAKKLYADSKTRNQIINIFGNEIYINNETVNSQLLAAKIFADQRLLNAVNNIIHPLVQQKFDEWFVVQKSPYVILEAAILIESGFHKLMDKIIVVNSPHDLRIARITARDKKPHDEIMQRIKNQMNDDERDKYADFIINNNENIPLLPQVLEINDKIKKCL
jgi:dephospho-CoA kinase